MGDDLPLNESEIFQEEKSIINRSKYERNPMITRRLRGKQVCKKCKNQCNQFTNMRFVDCFFDIVGERENGEVFMKKGCTPEFSGEIVVLRFDQMEDIQNWNYMEIATWSNQPPSDYDDEEVGEEGEEEEYEEEEQDGDNYLDVPQDENPFGNISQIPTS